MVVVKLSDMVLGSGDNIDAPLCGGLYKEEENLLVFLSGRGDMLQVCRLCQV